MASITTITPSSSSSHEVQQREIVSYLNKKNYDALLKKLIKENFAENLPICKEIAKHKYAPAFIAVSLRDWPNGIRDRAIQCAIPITCSMIEGDVRDHLLYRLARTMTQLYRWNKADTLANNITDEPTKNSLKAYIATAKITCKKPLAILNEIDDKLVSIIQNIKDALFIKAIENIVSLTEEEQKILLSNIPYDRIHRVHVVFLDYYKRKAKSTEGSQIKASLRTFTLNIPHFDNDVVKELSIVELAETYAELGDITAAEEIATHCLNNDDKTAVLKNIKRIERKEDIII